MTQPIQSDRLAPPIADRDRSPAARGPATPASPDAGDATAAAAPETDTARIHQGSALLRNAAATAGTGSVRDPEQARALAARITDALRRDPADAIKAYAATRREDVEAVLLATV